MSFRSKLANKNASKDLVAELVKHAGVEINGPKSYDLQVYDERFYDRVISGREMGLGESYQQGWWGAEKLDDLIARVMEADLRSRVKPSLHHLKLGVEARLRNRQSLGRAHKNASAHYDIGNDLYEKMLDKRMVYSCAYWKDADGLDAAQEAKLRLICDKLHLEPGMTLLDIGAGWGGLARYAAENYGVKVTGISPARNQVELATERCAGLDVKIYQTDYRSIGGNYDRIVSVGMLEHVGPANYKDFFDVNMRLLNKGGMILHHTIGSNASVHHTDPWFDKYIFPGGVLPSLEQLTKATDGRWALEDVHNFGPYYDTTLMAWYENIEAQWDSLPGYDEWFRRTWRYYLLSSAAAFRVRSLQLWQIVWRHAGRSSPTYQAVR